MKIKPEHYAYMRDTIRDRVDMSAVREAIMADGRYKDFDARFRWDCLHRAGLVPWVCEHVYPYANDDHIDTALRRIIRELD